MSWHERHEFLGRVVVAIVIGCVIFGFGLILASKPNETSPVTTTKLIPITTTTVTTTTQKPAPAPTTTSLGVLCHVNGVAFYTDLIHAQRIGPEHCKLPQ